MKRLDSVLLSLSLAALVAAAPVPHQATVLLPLEGEWTVHYVRAAPWHSEGVPHRFFGRRDPARDGYGQVYQSCWWHGFDWERQGSSIVVNYEDGLTVRFVLAEKGDRLEGDASGSRDGKTTFLPQPVRFIRNR